MNKNEIIINGVDVNGCEFISTDEFSSVCKLLNCDCGSFKGNNCYYKQLQREKLKNKKLEKTLKCKKRCKDETSDNGKQTRWKMTNKPILDACCGSRMFYFDKKNPNVVFMDNRELEDTLCDGRKLEIHPDVVADFRNMPFEDNSFNLVIFDPPHLLKVGEKSFMCKKYGKLQSTWTVDIEKGFDECMRVLKPHGTLIFKWSTRDISLNKLLDVISKQPIIYHKNNNTFFLVFLKEVEND